MPGGLLVSASSGKDEVVQAGDAEHGVVDAVALRVGSREGIRLHYSESPRPGGAADIL
ncbi:hypothetical protein SBD_6222 [Streptomyces bottropensis ATCC 25435]|uniref:Uncharacterized protein n=1 Tax=Streptomyces bottropensis ATCC 25435 TaxID=1054862 RepID=M3EAF5_9ACTN|nr:hypothetical protein SBD_6222 [Streptomyces bottropensis ATCC 25435]